MCPIGQGQLKCNTCQFEKTVVHSCGHRSCPRCQHHDTSQWLNRQQQKLLPVQYFMVTFTLPKQLRPLAWHNQKVVFDALINCAVSTLQTFAKNSKKLEGSLGMTAVLHTHSRRLDFHPHVHIILPAGALNKKRRQWKLLQGDYLFNEFALAKVFRARFLETMKQAGFSYVPLHPKQWMIECKPVGKGLPALTYLARYLYRGVISEKNIIDDDGTHVTFQYKDSRSGQFQTRKLKGADFIWLILQHVLPKGFRRARDYGFLHGNAKQFLFLIQRVLGVTKLPERKLKRSNFKCPRCQQSMIIAYFIPPAWRYG